MYRALLAGDGKTSEWSQQKDEITDFNHHAVRFATSAHKHTVIDVLALGRERITKKRISGVSYIWSVLRKVFGVGERWCVSRVFVVTSG